MQVKVIRSKGQASLVEWIEQGEVRRGVVPDDILFDRNKNIASITEDALATAIPYGVPFDEMNLAVDAKALARELHKYGVWTAKDVQDNQQAVMQAVRVVLNLTYVQIGNFSRSYVKEM